MHLPVNPSDEKILAFVDIWVDDLARGDYESAFNRTEQDPYYQWTPELMKAVIEGYGLPEPRRDGKIFKVTDRLTAAGSPHYQQVDRSDFVHPTLAEVVYDLPLNGKWSDLTATFRIDQSNEGCTVFLQQIHVF